MPSDPLRTAPRADTSPAPESPDPLAARHPILENDAASRWLGIEVVRADYGDTEITMVLRPEMLNGHGTAHGGMIFAFADSAFAICCNDRTDAAHLTVASGVDIDFVRPAHEGERLRARARAVHQSRSGLYDIEVTAAPAGAPPGENERVVAHFRGRSRTVPRPTPKETP